MPVTYFWKYRPFVQTFYTKPYIQRIFGHTYTYAHVVYLYILIPSILYNLIALTTCCYSITTKQNDDPERAC